MISLFSSPIQQAEVIRERTGYQVGHYCGEMGQDFWDARRWQREFETKQVLESLVCVLSINCAHPYDLLWFHHANMML